MKKVIVGIDVGVKGAIAIITKSGMSIVVHGMHVIEIEVAGKREDGSSKIRTIYNEKKLRKLFRKMKKLFDIRYVCIERPVVMPKQAAFASGSFEGFGYLKGLMSGMKIKYGSVMPGLWTREMFKVIKKKKDEKAHAFAKRKKMRAIKKARELFPSIKLKDDSGNDHDGFADALLIAEWARTVLYK